MGRCGLLPCSGGGVCVGGSFGRVIPQCSNCIDEKESRGSGAGGGHHYSVRSRGGP